MTHEVGDVVGVVTGLAQSRAKSGSQIAPDQTFDLRILTSAAKLSLDVRVGLFRYRIDPNIVTRPLAPA